jgi:hypothetical protein
MANWAGPTWSSPTWSRKVYWTGPNQFIDPSRSPSPLFSLLLLSGWGGWCSAAYVLPATSDADEMGLRFAQMWSIFLPNSICLTLPQAHALNPETLVHLQCSSGQSRFPLAHTYAGVASPYCSSSTPCRLYDSHTPVRPRLILAHDFFCK